MSEFDQRQARGLQRYKRWRRQHLKDNPLCVTCLKAGRRVAARELDHVKPCGNDPVLFWDSANVQGLCRPCHERKTSAENSGRARPWSEQRGAWESHLDAE